MSNNSLINKQFVVANLTADDPWCSSHGSANGSQELGAGILYYSLAYAVRAKTCVCLGSGGGFVPRLMRQAQRDLNLDDSRTVLVDGAANVTKARRDIWGSPCWLTDDSTFRRNFPDVELVLKLTKDAYDTFFVPQKISIDYLHIDADHHYDGAKLDWDLYRTLVSNHGVITLHDTVNTREPCGVPRLLQEIRCDSAYEVVNFPLAYGTAVIKRVDGDDEASATSG